MDQQSALNFIRFTTISCALVLVGLVFARAATAEVKPAFTLPPNHQSFYQIEKYGTHVGDMQNTLTYQHGVINYSSIAQAQGLATFFVNEEPTELSILDWPENAALTLPQQHSFNFTREEGHKKNQNIAFKYPQTGGTLINGSYKHKDYALTTDKKVWSRQLLLLLVSNDFRLNPDITSNHFFIVDKGHIYKFTYTVLATENIDFNGKPLPSVKIKITKEGSKRMSYVWLSKTQYYLPIKIEHYKGEDLNVRMRLNQLKINKDD